MAQERGLEVHKDSSVTVIVLGPRCSRIDDPLMQELRDELISTGDNADPPLLLVDIGNTEYFGTAFIEILLRIWNHLEPRGGRLAFCCVKKYCYEVLEIVQMTRLWEFYDTREEALAALNGAE